MKKIYVAAAILSLSGCASIMTAEQQSINVTASHNQPIDVTVDDKGTTSPGTVVVLRDGKDKVVRTSADGCDSATPIKKSITPVFFGNIVIGGLLGSTTDASTGKMWDYQDAVVINCTAK
jgi:hypothetical protein